MLVTGTTTVVVTGLGVVVAVVVTVVANVVVRVKVTGIVTGVLLMTVVVYVTENAVNRILAFIETTNLGKSSS